VASVTLTLADLPDYLRAKAAALASPDLTPALKVAQQLLVSATKQNFAQGTDPDDVPWAPLKHPRSRARDRKPGRIGSDLVLRDTGVLMASVTAAGAGSVQEINQGKLSFGTSVFYAKFLNLGTKRMVQRRFLGLTPVLRQRIGDAIRKRIVALVRGAR